MKHIKSVSFSPIIQPVNGKWENRVIVCFEMVDFRTSEENQFDEVSWVEFNSNTEELEFIITKLQAVVEKTKAAYSKPIEEVEE